MGADMRRLLTIRCEDAMIGATLDEAKGTTGILIVTGGTQTRIGSHRMFERLAVALAAAGHPCLRFDRRGVGDSEGEDRGWRGSGPDIAAVVSDFRRDHRGMEKLVGIGLCDGASALALFGGRPACRRHPDQSLAVETRPMSCQPRRSAIYRRRLTSLEGWGKLLTGTVLITDFKGMEESYAPMRRPRARGGRRDRARWPAGRLDPRHRGRHGIAAREIGRRAVRGIRTASPPYLIESDSTPSRAGRRRGLVQLALRIGELSRRG